jgi:lysophospholipase L1-like esterase
MTIGIWGDSIVYGSCDQESLGWVGRLRKDFPEDDWNSVYNRGVFGDTSSDLLKRFPVEFASIKPEVVIFAFGINDSAYRGEESNNLVPLEEVKENLKKLISLAKSSAQSIYIVGLTNVTESLVNPLPSSSTLKCFSNASIKKYDAALKDSSEESGVTFVGVQDVLSDADLADGLHPNAQGYEKLYRVISASIVI